ncbi:MAG TPA: MFS transporter [Pyrinomonadaceae bacterium]|nr:MFS transporter [Pyrinomonadaceae bacterium]
MGEIRASQATGASAPSAVITDAVVAANARIGRFRWVICGLLFFATTINYIDRQVIGILAKDLQRIIGWSEADYGNIVAAFNAAYALGLVLAGRLMDRFGTKIGYATGLVFWSLAAMGHAIARTTFGFGVARVALGFGEAGNFPAAIKTVAEWFPKRERALATGIFNAGSNVGAIIAPLTVPWIALHLGWQWAFILTGAIGFIWLMFWIPIYRAPEDHPRLSAAELAYIQSDPPDPVTRIPWVQLIPHRQTTAFAVGKYLTDPVWWFYLYWLPNFLRQSHGLDLSTVGLPLIMIYVVADFGSIGGGWLSSTLIKRGWPVNRARKTTMLLCALCVVPIVFASRVTSLWAAVGLISLAAAAHQGWSANIFTMVSDMFPRRAVGSVVGIGGMSGAMGGVTIAVVTGYILEQTHNYKLVFMIAGSAYLVALLIIHLLVPRLQPLEEIGPQTIRPFSLGSIAGFGFMGFVFGLFGGWVLNLIFRIPAQLSFSNNMVRGAIVGALIGIVCGVIIGQIICKTKR